MTVCTWCGWPSGRPTIVENVAEVLCQACRALVEAAKVIAMRLP